MKVLGSTRHSCNKLSFDQRGQGAMNMIQQTISGNRHPGKQIAPATVSPNSLS
ncbi:unknown protein [Microcystis aeruginosa NIES-843]|uniref:Uncharacterized protein n=1 Tax=Microcystis aeruginosa (strain NIES-843 / IAM M-2473) TaxID=449447 RepID=B0JLL1_MICAN|nr:unknown protein [Microcystis aeruginosa NIES-843]